VTAREPGKYGEECQCRCAEGDEAGRGGRPELAAQRGLILVEVRTPDSSRYWYAGTYDELFMTDEIRIATATRYILLAEGLTQRSFKAPELTAAERVANILRD
jgi:phosphoribosylaminoimidazole-succinocarboxamide synthase